MTVLMFLQHLFETQDSTLAFRNYQCYRGICHACMMTINGRKIRSCSYLIRPGEEVLIAPLEGYAVVKDLVVDFEKNK
jgi:succinate dehydrogenase/fumarate reductase-like Fe-S protein